MRDEIIIQRGPNRPTALEQQPFLDQLAPLQQKNDQFSRLARAAASIFSKLL